MQKWETWHQIMTDSSCSHWPFLAMKSLSLMTHEFDWTFHFHCQKIHFVSRCIPLFIIAVIKTERWITRHTLRRLWTSPLVRAENFMKWPLIPDCHGFFTLFHNTEMTFDGWKISGKLTGLLYLIDFEENNTGPLLAHQDRFLSKRIKDDNFS